MKDIEKALRDIEKIVAEAIEKLNKRGKKRVVDYRAILSSCSSNFTGSGGVASGRRSRRTVHPTEPVKEENK